MTWRDDEDATKRRSSGRAADQPGWAALRMANAAPNARTADAARMDAARIKSLSAFLGDSLSLGRALSTPIADPPQLTVRRVLKHLVKNLRATSPSAEISSQPYLGSIIGFCFISIF